MGTSGGEDIYRRMIGANGVVRDFYETLKAGTKSIVDRVLLSGVTPIMLDDLTSGFNITNNISLKEKYNEILGFTQEEVEHLIDATGIDRSMINVDLEHFYNGYMFHKKGINRVYNSAMMLYYFSQIWEDNRPPEYLIDSNLKMDYGRLKRLIQSEDNRQQLIDIVKNNGIAETVIDKFSLHQLTDSACFASLLCYMGLLTIDNSIPGRLWLKIPNYSTYTVYWGYIEELTRERNHEVKINTSILTESLYLLGYKSEPQSFINYISQNIVSRLSNRDLEQFDEKYLKIILLNNLFFSPAYLVLSETEVSTGYTDIYVQRKMGATPPALNEWVFEVKYIKKADKNNDTILQSKRDDARRQLEKYRSSHLFRDRTDVKYLMVIFIGKDKVEMTEEQFLSTCK
jgi:hypothetical protein